MYPSFDGIDQTHGALVAHFHDLVGFLEVEQGNIRHIKADNHAIFFIYLVVGFLHDHGFYLIVRIVGWFAFAGTQGYSEDEIRMKVFFHRFDREVIINTSVEHRDTVFPHGFEEQRERHGDTNRFSQISVFEDHRLFVIDIRTDTTEGNKQIVKVPGSFGCCLRIQSHKSLIHLNGVNQTLRQEVGLYLQGIGHIDREVCHFGRRIGFPEIIHIIIFHRSGLPIAKFFR